MLSINHDIRVKNRRHISMPVIAAIAILSLVLSTFASLLPATVSAATNLFSDGFESTPNHFTAWTSAGSAWDEENDDHSGSYSTEVKNTSSSELRKNISTVGQGSLVLSYWYKTPGGLDSDDEVMVQWSTDGTTWHTLVNYDSTATMANWAQATHNLPVGAENNAGFRFRFLAESLSSGDKFRLDDVLLTGNALNVAPSASNGSATVDEDDSVTITLSATDSDGPSSLTYSIVSHPSDGSLGAVSGNQVTYSPDQDFNGSDSFTFRANDGAANSNTATITITVNPINDIPEITLIGANPVNLSFGDTYVEPGYSAWDVEDGDITCCVVVDDSTLDTNTVGSYTITYNVEDSDEADAPQVTRTVHVSDVNAPVVTITPSTQTIEATSIAGAIANYVVSVLDDVDGDISGSESCSIASGSVFPIGITTVTCSATDSSSLVGSGSAAITVEDTTPPTITLNGSATVSMVAGGSYTEAGATATDTVDGSVSVTVGGNVVDPNTPGTYVVTFDAEDAAGNDAVQVTRTVVVTPPTEDTQALCTDGIDNDGDSQTDLNDSDCAAFVPSQSTSGGGGGSGSSGGGGGGGGSVTSGPLSIGYVNTNPGGGTVLGTTTATTTGGKVLGAESPSCGAYFTVYLKRGANNDREEVKKLQSFLNEHLGLSIPLTGVFGAMTFDAVSAFQVKYSDEILKPWFDQGLSNDMNPSGYAYKMTMHKINKLKCPSLNAPAPILP